MLSRKKGFILILIVVLSSSILIVMNYYTVRILSSLRAYINGESQYSKGQKDATVHLMTYIYSENETDFKRFKQEIAIPIADRNARIALVEGNTDAAKQFVRAKNDPDDVEDMVWFFKTFNKLKLFGKAIESWEAGDYMVEELNQLGIKAHQKIFDRSIADGERAALISDITNTSVQLTSKQQAFSDTLGKICRQVRVYILMANALGILVIIGTVLLYAGIQYKNLHRSRKLIIKQNENLKRINNELDKLVYNVTHDLRSPLASLRGLIALIDNETQDEVIKEYTLKMQQSVDRQENFIKETLQSIKTNDGLAPRLICHLTAIIDDVIAQNSYFDNGKQIKFLQELEVTKFEADPIKLKIIFNNLISNGIKYADFAKPEQWVKVKTFYDGLTCVIEITDNGIGIKEENLGKIFEKFFMVGNTINSTGLGLYLVKDTVLQKGGTIEVHSRSGAGSKFTIRLPVTSKLS